MIQYAPAFQRTFLSDVYNPKLYTKHKPEQKILQDDKLHKDSMQFPFLISDMVEIM